MRRLSFSPTAVIIIVLLVLALGGGACDESDAGLGAESTLCETATGIGGLSDSGKADGVQGADAHLAGVGDAYFPQAGNGGYDVLHYEIVMRCDPAAGMLAGSTSIEAEALWGLEAFNMDLAGLEVQGVDVNGAAAGFERAGQELTVRCPQFLDAGSTFSTKVTYSGTPVPITSTEGFLTTGWVRAGDTIYTLDEPEGAATWYALNDHPSDKATYSFQVTVPKPYVAAANGVLVEIRDDGRERTYLWEMRQPMANYLAALAVGEFVLEETVSPNGVPIRNYFDLELVEEAKEAFGRTGEMLAYFAETFGPYPFEVYGVVVPDAVVGGAMENQTLSLFGRDVLEGPLTDPVVGELWISHELAHQWFGDSVTIAEWQDIWLNEGFATYASWLWAEHDLGKTGMDTRVRWALDALAAEDETPPGDPGVRELFGVGVYQRGALTLHALRLTVGDDVFFDILREWVSRYTYGNATTEDFVALVVEKAGDLPRVELEALFDAWLFQEELPELPSTVVTSHAWTPACCPTDLRGTPDGSGPHRIRLSVRPV